MKSLAFSHFAILEFPWILEFEVALRQGQRAALGVSPKYRILPEQCDLLHVRKKINNLGLFAPFESRFQRWFPTRSEPWAMPQGLHDGAPLALKQILCLGT